MNDQLIIESEKKGFSAIYDGVPLISDLGGDPDFPELDRGKVHRSKASGEFGDCVRYESHFLDTDGEVARLRLDHYKDFLVSDFIFSREVQNKNPDDSFYDTSFNFPTFSPLDTDWLTYTWGLRDGTEGHGGGSWPTALHGRSTKDLPRAEGYAPLVILGKGSAAVISPLNHLMVSPLSTTEDDGSVKVCRGLHGSINSLEEGETLRTIFVFGGGLNEVLDSWGEKLLELGEKNLQDDYEDPLLERIGHWNAYGSYYSELFEGYDRKTLLDLDDYFDEEDIPIGYFGLDLWYDYKEIGKAKDYSPNEEKYPEGLGPISEKTGKPFVMHLSALDPDEKSSPFMTDTGPDYKSLYQDVSKTIRDSGGICAWHDWLRSEQTFWKSLRDNLEEPREWFKQMANAFDEAGLSVMLCMETVGMLMESTKYDNVNYCRNSTDYIFKQKGQLGRLWFGGERGFFYEKPQKFIEQQVLVGRLIDALGLYPFNDLFITNDSHPEGFEEDNPEREALMGVLSSGPVGLGDKLGEIDESVVEKLVFPDGTLARAEEAYRPVEGSIGNRALGFSSVSNIAGYEWKYFAVANISDWEAPYEFELPEAEGKVLFDWDKRETVERIAGNVQPAKLDYYVFAPVVSEIGVVGFLDKYVTATPKKIREMEELEAGVKLDMQLSSGEDYRFAISSGSSLAAVSCEPGEVLKVEENEETKIIVFKPYRGQISLELKTAMGSKG